MTITLITEYEIMHLHNPDIFLRRRFLPPLYALCYSDDELEQKTIYTSDNLSALEDIKDEIVDGIASGKERIDLR